MDGEIRSGPGSNDRPPHRSGAAGHPRPANLLAAALVLLLAFAAPAQDEPVPSYEVPPGLPAESARGDLARRLVAEVRAGDAVGSREASLALATLGADAVAEAVRALPSAPWHARALLVFAIGESGPGEVAPVILLASGDPSWAVREQAARGLWRIAGPGALAALLDLAEDPSWRVREAAAASLSLRGRRGPADRPAIVRALLALAGDDDREVRLAALSSLGGLRAGEARNLFLAGFAEEADDEELRDLCYESLLRLPGTEEDLLAALRRALDHPDERFFFEAAVRYAELTGAAILGTHADRLLRGLREDSPLAAKVFEKVGKDAVPLLLGDLRDSFARPVRRPAAGDPTRTVLDLVTRLLGAEGGPVLLGIFTEWEEAFPARRYAAILGRRHYAPTFRPIFRKVFDLPSFSELQGVILEGLADAPDAELAGPLLTILKSGSPLLMQSAADILARRPGIDLTAPILAILAAPECEPPLANKCMAVLARHRRPEIPDAARELLARPDPRLREIGAEWIRVVRDPAAALSILTAAYDREDGLDWGEAPEAPPEPPEGATGESLPPQPAWARREGVVRAILSAATRAAGQAALPLLERAAADPDAPVRTVAVEELGGVEAPGVRDVLLRIVGKESDCLVLAKALSALARHAVPEDRTLFAAALAGPDEDRRETALRALRNSAAPMAAGLVREAFDPRRWGEGSRKAAIEILASGRDRSDVGFIAGLLRTDPDPDVRHACAEALGESGVPEAVDALLSVLPGPESGFDELSREERELSEAAIAALGGLRAGRAGPALLALLRREWPLAVADASHDRVHFRMARLIVGSLGRTGFPDAVPELLGLLLGPELYRAHALLGSAPPAERGGLLGSLVAALVQWPDDRLTAECGQVLDRLTVNGGVGRIGEGYLDFLAGLFADPLREEVGEPRPRRGLSALLGRTVLAIAPRDTPFDLRALSQLTTSEAEAGRFAEASVDQAAYRDLLALLDPWEFAGNEKRVLATADVLEGLALAAAGREDEGFARCAAGRDRDPEDPYLLNLFAWYLAVAGFRLGDALPAAEEAARRAPSDPGILDTLGFVLGRLGRHEEAIPWLDAAVDLDREASQNAPRESPRRRDPWIIFRLAAACAKVGRAEEAAKLHEEARAMDDTIGELP